MDRYNTGRIQGLNGATCLVAANRQEQEYKVQGQQQDQVAHRFGIIDTLQKPRQPGNQDYYKESFAP